MNILLIHTGGTIGMAQTPHGLAPKEGLVEAAVRARLAPEDTLEIHAFTPLLDSADVGPQHWNQILDLIESHPNHRVIVTHGTDTLTYTATALTQALWGLQQSVVITGSMIPLEMQGDADANLDLALKALNDQVGVKVAFAGKLLEGAALAKLHTHEGDAFVSVADLTLSPPERRRFDKRALAVITLAPGLSPQTLTTMLKGLDGAVLRIFGSGTSPSVPELLKAIEGALQSGTRIRAVSQCLRGGLQPGTYAAGAGLWGLGVENGGAETSEAALVHLWLN